MIAVIRSSMEGVSREYFRKLLDGLVDEHKRDEAGKDVLDEPREVLDKGGPLEPRDHQGYDESPDANPGSPVEELSWHVPFAKVEQGLVEQQDRSRRSDDD